MTVYSYAISDGSDIAHGTGTISVSAAATAVVGVGTSFTTQLAVRDVIVSAGQLLSVAAIADNTHLTLAIAAGAAISGQAFDYVHPVNVESLSTTSLSAPKHSYQPYFEAIELANGHRRGLGKPVAKWRWGFLTRAQRDRLRSFCPSMSANVYIVTRINESADAYATFYGVMRWPEGDEDKDAGRRLNFEVEFRNLTQL